VEDRGVVKRIVVDRQKVKTRSESRRYRVEDRGVVKARRYRVQKQAGVKTGRTRKRRIAKGLREKHAG
jgi:hypothetical protein